MLDPHSASHTGTSAEAAAPPSSTPPHTAVRTYDPATIPPLDDCTLRLMATWAAGVQNQIVEFDYQTTSSGAPTTASESEPAATLKIQTRTYSRTSALATLHPVIHTPGDPEGEWIEPDAPLPAHQWDAAFWSEASVEKFLVPYLAALAGRRAVSVLQTVMHAWNHYPPERPAIGLLHRVGPLAEPISVERLIDVVYLDIGARQIGVQPLELYLPDCGDPLPYEPGPVISLPRTTCRTRTPIEAHDYLFDELTLRRLAEWASSCRGDAPVYFEYEWHAPLEQPLTAPPVDPAGRLVIPVHTPPTRADRPRVTSFRLTTDQGGSKILGTDRADTAFWGSGAVEHLMIPYYASVYGAVVRGAMDRIYEAWWMDDAHVSSGNGKALVEEDEEVVYVLVHLPKSDWDTQAAPGEEVSSLIGAVHGPRRSAGRTLELTPLSAFRRRDA